MKAVCLLSIARPRAAPTASHRRPSLREQQLHQERQREGREQELEGVGAEDGEHEEEDGGGHDEERGEELRARVAAEAPRHAPGQEDDGRAARRRDRAQHQEMVESERAEGGEDPGRQRRMVDVAQCRPRAAGQVVELVQEGAVGRVEARRPQEAARPERQGEEGPRREPGSRRGGGGHPRDDRAMAAGARAGRAALPSDGRSGEGRRAARSRRARLRSPRPGPGGGQRPTGGTPARRARGPGRSARRRAPARPAAPPR